MTKRSVRQIEIVDAMIVDALVSARAFERECEALAESQKIDEMADVIDELYAWIEERDAGRLEELGISMEEDARGFLVFRANGRRQPFVVRPREDMTIAAGSAILHLDPELPILEEEVYDEVLGRILAWAKGADAKRRKKPG